MFFVLLLLALSTSQASLCLASPTDAYVAPLLGEDHPNRTLDSYMVKFKQKSAYTLDQHWRTIGVNLSSSEQFHHLRILSGYTARIVSTIGTLIISKVYTNRNVFVQNTTNLDIVRRDYNVAEVLVDCILRKSSDGGWPSWNGSYTQSSVQKRNTVPYFYEETQPSYDVPWNLAVVGSPSKLKTPVLDDQHDYKYFVPSGRGVKVYVIDTGIDLRNPLFAGRAVNFENKSPDSRCDYVFEKDSHDEGSLDEDTTGLGATWEDNDGHGTS